MKSILLIGLGRFGRHIAQELNELGHQVMAIDSNEDRVNAVLSYVTNAQIGDSTSEYFLRSLGVGNFDVCIVTSAAIFKAHWKQHHCSRSWAQSLWSRVQSGMYKPSFCCATVRMKWSIRKSSWQSGRQSDTAPNTFWIISSCRTTTPSWK